MKLLHISYKTQSHIIQIYMLVRGLAHGDPVAVDFPDRVFFQKGFFDLKNMVPAAAFQILLVPGETDQLQTAEIKGGKCVFDAALKKQLRVPDAAQFEGAADHGAVIFHGMTSL